MDQSGDRHLSRRAFGGASTFMIVPRHVLGAPFVPPSDKITLASIGLGRQGQAVTMELLARPDVQVVAVCDCKSAKIMSSMATNDLLKSARRLLGPGYESWGADLASPGEAQLTQEFRTSLGMGGREPAKRLIEAYYGSRKAPPPAPTKAARLIAITANCWKRRRIWTPFTWRHPITGTPPSRSRPCASKARAVSEAHDPYHRRCAPHGADWRAK